jgi:hypothetical protein
VHYSSEALSGRRGSARPHNHTGELAATVATARFAGTGRPWRAACVGQALGRFAEVATAAAAAAAGLRRAGWMPGGSAVCGGRGSCSGHGGICGVRTGGSRRFAAGGRR